MHTAYALTVMISAFLAVLSFGVFFFYAKSAARAQRKESNATLLNSFPAEFLDPSRGPRRLVPLAAVATLAVTSLGAYLFTFMGMLRPVEGNEVTVSAIFLIIFATGTAVTLFLAAFFPLSRPTQSLMAMLLLVFFVVAVGLFPMVTTTGGTYFFQLNPIVSYVMAGVGGSCLLFLVNPKLKNWATLDKTEVNGTTVWLKPKYNWLAITVWYAYCANAALMVLLFVSALLSILG